MFDLYSDIIIEIKNYYINICSIPTKEPFFHNVFYNTNRLIPKAIAIKYIITARMY